jgi:hypothetical protein
MTQGISTTLKPPEYKWMFTNQGSTLDSRACKLAGRLLSLVLVVDKLKLDE